MNAQFLTRLLYKMLWKLVSRTNWTDYKSDVIVKLAFDINATYTIHVKIQTSSSVARW